jgi:hypothetical protein
MSPRVAKPKLTKAKLTKPITKPKPKPIKPITEARAAPRKLSKTEWLERNAWWAFPTPPKPIPDQTHYVTIYRPVQLIDVLPIASRTPWSSIWK